MGIVLGTTASVNRHNGRSVVHAPLAALWDGRKDKKIYRNYLLARSVAERGLAQRETDIHILQWTYAESQKEDSAPSSYF